MITVSGPADNASSNYYDVFAERPLPKEPPSVADQPQAQPGETENRMKAEGDLRKALSPDLNLLEREQSIIAQFKTLNYAHEKFPLVKEIFKVYAERCRANGLSVQDFAAEVKQRLANNILDPFEGVHSDLKNDLLGTYRRLVILADEVVQAKELPYTSPWLQLYELEKETGFSIQEPKDLFLKSEIAQYASIISEHLKSNVTYAALVMGLNTKLSQFCWDTFIPNTIKMMQYLEKEGELELLKKMVHDYVVLISMMNSFTNPQELRKWLLDWLTESLPYLAKYTSLEHLEASLNTHGLAKLKNWSVNAYLLTKIYCEKAEMFAKTDWQKALDYLVRAEKTMEYKLWTWPAPFNSALIELMQKNAKRHINEVRRSLEK